MRAYGSGHEIRPRCYPRLCGGTEQTAAPIRTYHGLSQRLLGKRPFQPRELSYNRIIGRFGWGCWGKVDSRGDLCYGCNSTAGRHPGGGTISPQSGGHTKPGRISIWILSASNTTANCCDYCGRLATSGCGICGYRICDWHKHPGRRDLKAAGPVTPGVCNESELSARNPVREFLTNNAAIPPPHPSVCSALVTA